MNAPHDKPIILVADDDEDFLTQLRMQLEAAGYLPQTAQTLDDARRIFDSQTIDLAIIDLMMEQQDGGFTLCYFLRKHDPHVPIILVSAVASETGLRFDAATDEERSWVKADVFLAKPIRFEQLHAEIQRLTGPYSRRVTWS